jgi:hypothetical protein
VQVQVSDPGFVRIDEPTSAIHAAAALSMTIGSSARFGCGIPVVAGSRALGQGELVRFAGVEDSSAQTVAMARPLSYRTNLLLVETTGVPVKVRLTLRYLFAAGVTVSAGATSTREVELAGGTELTLSDVGRSIIGADRDAFGDIHNALLDVEVSGGGGRVLVFLESIDNATGDTAVRRE